MQKLTLGLGISAQSNRFALFEWNGEKFKVIDERALIADILAKFEKYALYITVAITPILLFC